MLSVQNLHKSYQVGKTTYEVLKGVSLEVDDGAFVAVMGPERLRQDHAAQLHLVLHPRGQRQHHPARRGTRAAGRRCAGKGA